MDATRPSPTTVASAFAILIASADARRFASPIRLHDRALFEMSELVSRGHLTIDTANWRLVPSADGGYSIAGLADTLLILSEEGLLQRDPVATNYVVSSELRQWGSRELSALAPEERQRVRQVALRWKARASVSSKRVA